MIYIFRKEMKKWQNILWVVFVALAASGVSMIFFRPKGRGDLCITSVNGQPVTLDEYRKALTELHERLNALRPYAAMYGLSEEDFINTFFGSSPEDLAVRTCIREKLMDSVKDKLNIRFDEEWFKGELLKTLPHLTDENGKVNMDAYHGYMQRLSLTPAQYEHRKEDEFKRELCTRFVQHASYIPFYAAKELYQQTHTLKRFRILEIPQSHFLKIVEQNKASDADLEAFYVKHEEDYRVPEKRRARYWILSPNDYASKIVIDDQTIQNFYEKNKSTMFRIPPKVSVRHLLIKNSADAQTKIADLAARAHKDPASFATLVKAYSQDEKTAKSGGVTGFFNKGTYDAEFEKTAFRLKEKGEISEVIKTGNGYELLQLIERIQASEKPLSLVRDEIVKAIKTKKTALGVRSDLERVIRGARENQLLVEQFALGLNLKAIETGWLTEQNAATNNESAEGMLTKKLFGKNKLAGHVGYFPHENNYILYQLLESRKSAIQPFEIIKTKVAADYYNEDAESKAKVALKQLKADLLSNKTTLVQASQRMGGVLHITKLLKSGDKLDLDNTGNLNTRIFELVEPNQVLVHMTDLKYFVAQIDGSEVNQDVNQEKLSQIIKQERFKNTTLEIGAFIASLERNATIEPVDKKMIDMGRNQ